MDSLHMKDMKEGFIDTLPIIVGVIPFGITCGIMGLSAGLTHWEVIWMSLIVFAGASQFMSIAMLGAGISGWGIIVFTTFLVNLRHLIMGASLAPYLLRENAPLQALLSFFLTDESYALTVSRIDREGYSPHYQLGVNIFLYFIWALSTVLGVVLAKHISDPLKWGIDFAIPATFMVLLIPRLVSKASIIVCLISGITTVIGIQFLPGKWYIILACLVASVSGFIYERRNKYEG